MADNHASFKATRYTIIGNIYENPKLLKAWRDFIHDSTARDGDVLLSTHYDQCDGRDVNVIGH